MTYLVITRLDADGRINKYQDRLTLAEAEAMVARIAPKFPQAFVMAHPTGGEGLSNARDYIADPVAKTVTLNSLPIPKEQLNAPILAAIEARERTQARALREHVLGDVNAKARLQTIDDEIRALRLQLVP